MLRVANSTPMVDFESKWNSLRVKRLNKLDLPTPESPMMTTAVVARTVEVGSESGNVREEKRKHKQTQQVYAFKILQKARIVAFQQQKNTMNEKNILMMTSSSGPQS